MADANNHDTARADYLRGLAMRPNEAFTAWRQLNPSEQFLVITQMGMFYDLAFVRTFQAMAGKHVRPSVEITITNAPRIQHTPQALRAAGFGLQPGSSTTQYWVHPSGRQVWLIAPPKSLPPPSLFPSTLNPEIADEDRLGQADQLVQRYRLLEQKAVEIKRRRVTRSQSPKEYYESRAYWWQDHATWRRDVDSLEDELDPATLSRLASTERAQIQQRMQALKNLTGVAPQTMLEPLEAIKPR
ncbi:hypothetical protein [Rhodoferax sp.]|uniref:hypothetical protein n=1 Tax=Rhodoferax sp. TaxID=50421 RepID=UPI0027643981|nr:hypothetical protein [Rhodoferax sp.]